MKFDTHAKILAFISILFGGIWLSFSLIYFTINFIQTTSHWMFLTSLSPILVLISLPGIFALKFAIPLLKEANKENIIGSVGSITAMIILFCWYHSLYYLLPLFINSVSFLSELICIFLFLIMLPIYITISKYIIKKEFNQTVGIRDLIGKTTIGIFSFLLFLLFFQIFNPNIGDHNFRPDPTNAQDMFWQSFIGLLPLIIGVIFYKLVMYLLNLKSTEKTA